ncbi:MAG TPA: choice-of-anchor K domain-containing protein [Anaerolineae bacterium]|nr:choice-of-anchor K domain-containing protein [Anaerolineae bacterium]HNU03224.1 choice-of-anchor K domain-containing protein [Anaerolineae bacterium]
MRTYFNNFRTRRWARRAVIVSATLALTLVFAAAAFALTAGNVDGVWGNPTPSNTTEFRWCYGPDNVSGPAGDPTNCSTSNAGIQNGSPGSSTLADENQFRYGTPTLGSGSQYRSGYGFNGNNNVGPITANQPFFLGRFTHYNKPIQANNVLTGIGLAVTLTDLKCDDNSTPTEGSTQTFNYTFTHDETDNNASPCPYGDSTGYGCDDKVTVSQQADTTFTCPEGERTVQILGFYTNANCHLSYSGPTSASFITGERQDNPACLWARISDPSEPLAVSLASFGAQWSGDQVAVTWDTVSEIDNLGFKLYRSQTADALGELVTAEMIPSQSPGGTQGFSYSFTDSNVTPGSTYWYTLADVDVWGVETAHGPVSAAPQTPTAVTLASLAADTTPASPVLPALLALTLALAALGAGLVWRSRTQAR